MLQSLFNRYKWTFGVVLVLVLVVTAMYFPNYYYAQSIEASTRVRDKHSFQSAVAYLESTLASVETDKEKANTLIQIARLYHSGKEGEVVPDLEKAVEAYTRAYEEFGSQLAGMELGNLYHYETESPIYSPRKAEGIYRNILMYYNGQPPESIDPVVYAETRNHLSMIRASQEGFQDFDTTPGPFQELRGDEQDFTLRPEETRPVPPPVRIPPVSRRPPAGPVNDPEDGEADTQDQPVFPINPDLDPITGQYRNDPQNTHDHGVVQSIQQSIANLSRHTDIVLDIPSCFQQVRALCEARGGKHYTEVLDAIERSTTSQSHSGMRESEVLQLVWNRICMLPPREQEAAKHNLALELEGALDFSGKPICGVGRTNRLIDSLNVVDTLVTIKPKWVLNQEMMDKAGQIRRALIAELTPEEQEALDALEPTPEQNRIYDQFYNQFKATLLEQFRRDYVDRGLIEEEILKNELEKWVA